MKKIYCDCGENSYDISIFSNNLTKILTENLQKLKPSGEYIFVITDKNVMPVCGELVANAIEKYGAKSNFIFTPLVAPSKFGETSKTIANYGAVCDELIKHKIERGSLIIALGGGVVGDLTGFVAATIIRGVRFLQIPTSLLAMVDSSVGGKTAINSPFGKNMIGAFYQPCAVLIDTAVLAKLPQREFSAGMAEVIKYGAIMDEEFFIWLEENITDLMNQNINKIEYAIEKSVNHKAKIVAMDEKEGGIRAILNFGHTFAHAIEMLYEYKKIIHGEAVAVGMVLAVEYALFHGIINDNNYLKRLINLLIKAKLPTKIQDLRKVNASITPEILSEFMLADKKVENAKITLILPENCGNVKIHKNIATQDMIKFFEMVMK